MKTPMTKTSLAMILAIGGAPAAQAEPEMVEYRLESYAARNSHVNIENGPLVVTPIKSEAWSAIWYVTKVDGTYSEIRNRWTGCYLHVEFGRLECSERKPGWHSAQWRFDALQGTSFITNRWTSCKIGNEGGKLNCSKSLSDNQQWILIPVNPVSVIRKPKPKPVAAPAPAPAPMAAPPPPPAPKRPLIVTLYYDDDNQAIPFVGVDDGSYDGIKNVVLSGREYPNFASLFFTNTNTSINDNVEAVRIAQGLKVTFYKDANYQGPRVTLTCGLHEFIDDSENEISSMRVEDDPAGENCEWQNYQIYDWNLPSR